MSERENMLAALGAFMRQRPGLEYGNYGDPRSYRAELRSIARDLDDARRLLRSVELSSMTAETLRDAFPRAFSGRLSWDGARLSYCTGQYFPTEYRKAVCAVLARALWAHYRGEDGAISADGLRAMFRRTYGRGLASRWFS